MKKPKALKATLLTLCALIILAAAGYFSIKANFWGPAPVSKNEQAVSLYFLHATKTTLVKEQRSMSLTYTSDDLSALVRMLIAGPKNTVDFKRAIPEKTKLLSLTQDANLVTVNFSRDYYGPSGADDMLAAFTVVNTLCEVPGVRKVAILVEGQELIGNNKKPLGALGKDDIVYEGSQTQQDSTVLSLYFPNAGAQYLQNEKRTVTIKDKEPLAKLALQELMKGPEDKQAQKPIPSEAKLISAETTDNICFVNFSREFVDKHTAGSTAEIMAVYSIVNTLTEISGIHKVQFLIEGKKEETFGSLVFNEPFERDAALLKGNTESNRTNDVIKSQTTASP